MLTEIKRVSLHGFTQSELERTKLEVNPNSIEVKEKSLNLEINLYDKYNIPRDKIIYIFGGNLGVPQGIEFLKKNIDYCKSIKEAFFLVVGDGTEYKQFYNWIQTESIKNTLLIKELPKNEYDEIINISHVGLIFLNPHFSIPNFPSRILSYMQNYLPVICATDLITDIGEIAVQNNFGYKCLTTDLEAFFDFVKKLLNKDLRERMGNNSYKYLINEFNKLDISPIIEYSSLNKITQLFFNITNENINPNPVFEQLELQNIQAWKTQYGGFTSDILKLLKSKLNINILPIKEIPKKNKKLISLVLFDSTYTPERVYNYSEFKQKKPPHFYTKVLNSALDQYRRYLPDWIIRIYIDNTIPIQNYKNNKAIPNETKVVLDKFFINNNCEIFKVDCDYFSSNGKHYNLIQVIFRYLTLFDENVTTCFCGDIDNICSRLLAEHLINFDKSNSDWLLFKPMSAYDRPFFNKMCVDNFMAGMIAFKKNQDQIYNIEIFQALYRIIDYYYLNKDKLDNICSVLINIDKPLYYGYEEVYLTTIIQYIINTFNLKVDTIPLYWDYGMTPVDSFIFTMSYGINSFLTDDFINFLLIVYLLKISSKINLRLYNFLHSL